MGKKGNWFSALKRAFTSTTKDIVSNVAEKKNTREKKRWAFGRSKHGEINSFIPLYREPSSIEQILEDTEREHQYKIHQVPHRKTEVEHDKIHQVPPKKVDVEHEKIYQLPPKRIDCAQNYQLHQLPPKKVDIEREHNIRVHQVPSKKAQMLKTPAPRPRITPNYAQYSAVKIQSVYRGYMARKNYRALKGLMRLQGVMRGQSVKRQTINTMRCMQMLVRVQSQVRARRLQMMDTRSLQHQQQAQRKGEMEIQSSFSKWSFAHQSDAEALETWDDSVLTKEELEARMRRKVEAVIKRERALAYAYSHQLLNSATTPKSAHGVLSNGFPWWWTLVEHQPSPTQIDTPTRRPATSTSTKPKPKPNKLKSRPKPTTLRDDESLTSCPPFAVPNYMTPTASAKAKVKTHLHYHHEEKPKRFSFGLGWSRGKEDTSRSSVVGARHRSTLSIGSVDSTLSLPVGAGWRRCK
ncbi:protein IQ-DOMAIN 13 [Typha angustifolia]|uniref:protein IQ-DOMAIN 13 n=1 Tax=Typha angustifolia TaxID=59011 RepID=UPI003C2F4A94